MRFNITDNSEESTSQTTENPTVSLNNFITNLNKGVADLQKMKEEMQAKMKAQFDVMIKDFFTLVPKAKAIVWTQYSPYFNDGDECVFSVNDVSVLNFVPTYVSYDYNEADEDEDEEDYDDDDITDSDEPSKEPRLVVDDSTNSNLHILTKEELEACNAVRNFISQNEDLMEDLYGNHVGIIITENGAQVSDYDHD